MMQIMNTNPSLSVLTGTGQTALTGNRVIRNTYLFTSLLHLLGFMNSDD